MCWLCLVVAAVMPPKKQGRARPASGAQADGTSQAELLAAMREMQNEMRTLRQAARAGAAQPNPTTSTQEVAAPVGPESGVSLREWVGMKLDSFDGSGTPI